jgi:hypothetical protein
MVSISFALFTLLFSFSGGSHTFSKYKTDSIHLSLGQLESIVQQPINNASLVHFNDTVYWQVITNSNRKDLMNEMKAPAPVIVYVNSLIGKILENGEKAMNWAGKAARDASTMFWAAGQIVMVAVGFALYFRMRKRRAAKP